MKVPALVQDLLRVNSNMVSIPDGSGNYHLHISIDNQQVFNTTNQIIDESLWVGREMNVIDGLVLFKSAAVGAWDNDLDQVNTILYLLREDPVVISH